MDFTVDVKYIYGDIHGLFFKKTLLLHWDLNNMDDNWQTTFLMNSGEWKMYILSKSHWFFFKSSTDNNSKLAQVLPYCYQAGKVPEPSLTKIHDGKWRHLVSVENWLQDQSEYCH